MGEPDGQIASTIDTLRAQVLDLRRRVYRSDIADYLRGQGRSPRFPIQFRSQYGEDLWLWDLLAPKTDGYFIEVGAYDGYTLSVSYALEAIGWTGLLVEPSPQRAEQARLRRPGSRVVNAALSRAGSKGDAVFTYAPTHEMLSYLVTNPGHRDVVRQAEQGQEKELSVPLTSMNTLLADHKGPIDVAVIDVEGGELSLLDGFDLGRFRPRVLVIEDGPPKPSSPLLNYMGRFDYTPAAHIALSRVFIRSDEAALINRAAQIPF